MCRLRQYQWDDAPITNATVDRHVEAREREEQRKRARAREDAIKLHARSQYLKDSGGTGTDFDKAWPKLRQRITEEIEEERARAVARVDERVRESQRSHQHSRI